MVLVAGTILFYSESREKPDLNRRPNPDPDRVKKSLQVSRLSDRGASGPDREPRTNYAAFCVGQLRTPCFGQVFMQAEHFRQSCSSDRPA